MARRRLEPGTHGQIREIQTKDGWKYVTTVRGIDGRYFECSGSATGQDEARARLQNNLARRREAGVLGDAGDRLTPDSTVADVAAGWAAHIEKLNIGEPGTRHEERRLIQACIVPQLGALAVRELRRKRVLDWYMAHHDVTPRQAANALSVLRRIGEWAVAMELRESNFCDGVHRVRREEGEDPEAPNAAELEAFRRVVRDWMDRRGRMGPRPSSLLLDYIEVALGTGGRTGEVLALRWIDLDLLGEEPSATIQGEVQEGKGRKKQRVDRTKTRSGKRQVTIPAATVAALVERRRKYPDSFYVFETKNGTPVGLQEVQRQIRNVRRWAGLPETWVPYSFRKAAVTAVAEEEGPEAAARFAGHKMSNITEKYYWKKDVRVGNLVSSLEKLAPHQIEAFINMAAAMAPPE